MKYASARYFRELTAEIMGRCPPPDRVTVKWRRVKKSTLGGALGDVEKKGTTFWIRVAMEQTEDGIRDACIHEYAHVVDWRPYHHWEMDHGPTWGVLYAMVYRKVNRCT